MEAGGIDRRAEGHKGMEVCQDQWRRQLREKQIFAYTNNNVLSSTTWHLLINQLRTIPPSARALAT